MSNQKCIFFNERMCVECNMQIENKLRHVCCGYTTFSTKNNLEVCDKCPWYYKKDCPIYHTKISYTYNPRNIDIHLKKIENCATRLPSRFIPEIEPYITNKNREYIQRIFKKYPIIALSLKHFITPKGKTTSLYQKIRRIGLHKYLGYHEEILLHTDVKDELCIHLIYHPQKFVNIVNSLNPDYITTFDTFSYLNMPTCLIDIQIKRVKSVLKYMTKINAKVIGLLIGATVSQVRDYILTLRELGCKIIAVPSYEMRKQQLIKDIKIRIREIKNLGLSTLLLSSGPGKSANRRVLADYYLKNVMLKRDEAEQYNLIKHLSLLQLPKYF